MFKRFLVAFAGVVSLLLGLAFLGSAGWLFSVVGPQGMVILDAGRITGSPEATAIVVDVEQLKVNLPYVGVFGQSDLIVTSDVSKPAQPVFVSVGSAELADAFLAGAAYDVAHFDTTSNGWTMTAVAGDLPLAVPNLVLWRASAQGDPAVLPMQFDPPFTMLLMRADRGAPIDVVLKVRFTLPQYSDAMRVGLGAGGVLIVIAILLLWIAISVMSRRGRHRKESGHG